jgi:hypothetical protein
LSKINSAKKQYRNNKNDPPCFSIPDENLKTIEITPWYQVEESQPGIDLRSDYANIRG